MQGYNKIVLMGNLTKDPEVEHTQGGTVCTKFTIAVNRKWRDRSGELSEEVDFIPIVCFAGVAESSGKYLKKGSGAFIEGRLSIKSFEPKSGGDRRWWTQVVANRVIFLGRSKSKEEESGDTEETPGDVPFTNGEPGGPPDDGSAAGW